MKLKPRYVSLFYILDFELYKDTLFQMWCEESETITFIPEWLDESFDRFKQLVTASKDSKSINLCAIHREDYEKYVVYNDLVIKEIKDWMELFYDLDLK